MLYLTVQVEGRIIADKEMCIEERGVFLSFLKKSLRDFAHTCEGVGYFFFVIPSL